MPMRTRAVNAPLTAELALSSRYDAVEVAEQVLAALCTGAGWGEDERYWVVAATREAVANAIRHGNREREELPVAVRLEVTPAEVVVRVADRGPGFRPEDVPDPTAPENLLRPSGRGIFYMKRFMDHVTFAPREGGGTVVLMRRRRRPPERSTA